MRYEIDPFGQVFPVADTAGMRSPVQCAYCQNVYDLGTVEVTARYVDCSMWKAPCCGVQVDDRGESGWAARKHYYPLDGDR